MLGIRRVFKRFVDMLINYKIAVLTGGREAVLRLFKCFVDMLINNKIAVLTGGREAVRR